MNKSETGKLGEDLACAYLVDKGFTILFRNVRQKWGELDIVARGKNGILAIVEVKAMKDNSPFAPEENLTKAKFKKLARTASLFVGSHPELIKEKKGWRIDLAAIIFTPAGDYQVNYYENISPV